MEVEYSTYMFLYILCFLNKRFISVKLIKAFTANFLFYQIYT